MKRIVFISDTHNLHEHVQLPKGDILIHAGDFTGQGQQHEVFSFFRWLTEQSNAFEHVIFIAGNHELSFERRGSWLQTSLEELPANVHYLEDSEIVIDGIKFYGSPWQPEFYNWAFNLPRGKALAEKWALIPNDTDVLITHGPPNGICDYTLRDLIGTGCVDLLDRVLSIRPKIHVFGHIHEAYGYKEFNGTTFINASTMRTLSYSVNNDPVVVDYGINYVDFVTE
jgi:predicted phosphodiesterase